MKAMDLLTGLNNVRDSYVIGAEEFRQGKQKAQIKRLSTRRIWLVAAVIALMLLLVGCAVVYVLHLQDMKIGEVVVTQGAEIGLSGEYIPETEWVNTLVSLQGYNGSSEQLALREWLEFQEGYDTDYALLDENNYNESGVPDQYNLTYGCYTFEMMDKLNEILEKHNLKPLGTIMYMDIGEEPMFYRALQIDRLCHDNVQITRMGGYFFPEGSFCAKFEFTLNEVERYADYTYTQNGYLFPYPDTITRIDLWSQWPFTTSDGTEVLLATFENQFKIICERNDGFITISTENNNWYAPDGVPSESISRQEAETIADSFNYSIYPQPCDPSEVEQMRLEYPRRAEEKRFMMGFRIAADDIKGERWFPPEEYAGSYEQYISYLLANENNTDNKNVNQLQYCITDLNNDGQPEILLQYADTGIYREILEMANLGSQQPEVSIRYIRGNVYEGPVFELISDNAKWDGFICYEFKDFSWNDIACLRFDPETKTWTQSSTKGSTPNAVWETISESEANAIRRSFKPLSLDTKPLSQFNMNG